VGEFSFSAVPKGLPEAGGQYPGVLLFSAEVPQPTCFPAKGEDLCYWWSLLRVGRFRALAGLGRDRRLS